MVKYHQDKFVRNNFMKKTIFFKKVNAITAVYSKKQLNRKNMLLLNFRWKTKVKLF